ncbi:MAG: potassium-transporting ATPase subunit C [Deltaproteobacteria bacterium RBG_16_54_18]|nr:MAG: potassium-transporting ATPase subunit C [Deltaproteobacteria bacterium RBG_16_54_18]
MRHATQALFVFVVFSLLCGLVFPLCITAVSQLLFSWRANGSLLSSQKQIVGSELIGQMFKGPRYFHGRPSATDPAYNASGSSGSNFGPSNAKFLQEIKDRIEAVRLANGVPFDTPIPADLVLASASGLDPHISIESALLQVKRIAKERGLSESEVEGLVRRCIEHRFAGIWGQPRVNVLKLNLALDAGKKN